MTDFEPVAPRPGGIRGWWQGLSRGGRIAVIVAAVLVFGAISSALGLGEEDEEEGAGPTTTEAPAEEPAATTTSVPDDSLFVPDLEAGDCIQEPEAGAFSVVSVDCDEPHAFEVTGFHDLEGDDDAYPTEQEMAAAADGPCVAAFEDHVGTSPEASDLSSLPFLFPTAGGWASGQREVVCVAATDDGSLLEAPATSET